MQKLNWEMKSSLELRASARLAYHSALHASKRQSALVDTGKLESGL
jgi:hypothetical protein